MSWGQAAGAGISLIGGVVGALGAKSSAEAQQRAALANAGFMDVRAEEAERNRGIALANAGMEVNDARVKNRAMIGSVRAAYGSSGFAMEGSALDVIQATAAEQELDVEKILYKGDLQAMALTDQANSFRTQAAIYRMGGQNALTAGSYNMATSLLSGLSGAANSLAPALK